MGRRIQIEIDTSNMSEKVTVLVNQMQVNGTLSTFTERIISAYINGFNPNKNKNEKQQETQKEEQKQTSGTVPSQALDDLMKVVLDLKESMEELKESQPSIDLNQIEKLFSSRPVQNVASVQSVTDVKVDTQITNTLPSNIKEVKTNKISTSNKDGKKKPNLAALKKLKGGG